MCNYMLPDTSSVSDCSSTKSVTTLVFHLATDFVFTREEEQEKKKNLLSLILNL